MIPSSFSPKWAGERQYRNTRRIRSFFHKATRADAVFYIQKGKIKLTVISQRGKEAVVGILGLGHFFGEGCLNGHPQRITTATAIEDCLITRIAQTAMIAAMHDEPKVSELFMADLLDRNGRIEEDLTGC